MTIPVMKRALVIEDNPGDARLLREMLIEDNLAGPDMMLRYDSQKGSTISFCWT